MIVIKIAIPIKLYLPSEIFDNFSGYIIYDINNKSVIDTTHEVPLLKSVSTLLNWVKNWGIMDVIVLRIDKALVSFFSNKKINIFIGVPFDNPKNLIDKYLKRTLVL